MEFLKGIDTTAIMIWIAPGCFIALSRSFALKGSFPSFSKDDMAVLLLSSVIYNFIFTAIFSTPVFDAETLRKAWSESRWVPSLIFLPLIVGFVFGLVESRDAVGRMLRKFGFSFPSPTPTAWETLFREMKDNCVLILTFQDGSLVYGRWTRGAGLSSASTDPEIMDIFIAETGLLDAQQQYKAHFPQRGIYVAASQIRSIEIIPV